MSLGVVNFLHWGLPKKWYVVAGANEEHAIKLENMIAKIVKQSPDATDSFKQCQNIMAHKSYLPTPKFLSDHNIEHTEIVQEMGQFVVTFPRAYHFGWNLGVNVAEATNYANEDWIPFGLKTKQCSCDWFETKGKGGNKLVFSMDPFLRK